MVWKPESLDSHSAWAVKLTLIESK
jgi:hypothetical protein